MVKRIGSTRRKTRNKLTKSLREKGKLSLSRYFAKFSSGDAIVLKAEPAVQKGSYHMRFHGRKGMVEGKKGSCYEVAIRDGSKRKTLIVHPVHLRKVGK